MYKKGIFIFLAIIAAVLTLTLLIKDTDVLNKQNKQSNKDNEENNQLTETNTTSPNQLIETIISNAEKGRIPDFPFIAGETSFKEVINELGDPQSLTHTVSGNYANFQQSDLSIGYELSNVFDIRLNNSILNEIHLEELKEFAGEPDQITYYKDQTTDQIILTYHVNSSYKLKWIFSKPNEQDPNPTVHHISVVTQAHEQLTQTISEMTLDEKIGQMIFAGISGTVVDQQTENLILHDKIGGIIFFNRNLNSPSQILKLLNNLKKVNSNNNFPLFFGIDEEGGQISRLQSAFTPLPSNQVVGQVNNVSFAYELGTILGKELSTFGFNLDFAPVLDVNSNPNNPVIGNRSYGNNKDLVAKLGVETMKGIQSKNVISVIKHFPGHGDTSVDSHYELPLVNKSKEELQQLELIPFKKAIAEGADVIMIAHILLPKIDPSSPASMSKTIIDGLLRDELSFDGVVITDDLTMEAITDNYSISRASVESIKAGSDIILIAHNYENITSSVQAIKNAINNGELSEQRINDSVRRILLLKEKYKLTNSQINEANVDEINELINQLEEKYNS
ncbi:beta-N-acetylhexosaminidase [Lysinibacillus composti]|nr:beta-N-acetylhexosaminidase [Lysinibacillus composti]MBM7609569.1 beta-N-acetylhexosaminidase [Lysinibacillus composti]